jgi:GTP-binding protein HflX
VGFIRDLPHGLVDAFQATLQEAVDADLLLHVVDAANPAYPEQIAQVQLVLAEIGASHIPQLLVFNKYDAMPPEARPKQLQDMYEMDGRKVPRIFVSARQGEGVAALREQLGNMVAVAVSKGIPPDQAAESSSLPT